MHLSDAFLLDGFRANFFIARRSDNIRGSGTQIDPWRANNATEFDTLLATTIPSLVPDGTGVQINLGPGEFQTNGYADGVSGGWTARAGWKIQGSGMDVTILKLTAPSQGFTANKHYFAVGHPLPSQTNGRRVDYFQLADLTVDCGLTTASVACGAVRVMGDHVRCRRVKAENWGSRTSSFEVCSVISLVISDPEATNPGTVDAGIEECVTHATIPAP